MYIIVNIYLSYVSELQRTIAVIGFRAVGKSSMTAQFVDGHFKEEYDPTIEAEMYKQIRINKTVISIYIVDTAGQVSNSLFLAISIYNSFIAKYLCCRMSTQVSLVRL